MNSLAKRARWAFLIVLSCLCVSSGALHGQGTAFSYRGQLSNAGGPATGAFDFQTVVYDSVSGGIAVGGPVTNSSAVSNGLFIVLLDFGAGVFTGPDRWLEIGVRTNGGSATPFTTLAPRQRVLPMPYAITAANLAGGGLSGTYGSALNFNNAANQFTGAFTGNGGGMTNLASGLSVKDFGARGDGLTDDTAAFQSAIVAAGGASASLFIPSGTYVIGNLFLSNNCVISGAGFSSVLKSKGGSLGYMIEAGTNMLCISSLNLDGRYGVVQSVAQAGTTNVEPDASVFRGGIAAWNLGPVRLTDLFVHDFRGYGMKIAGPDNVSIRAGYALVRGCLATNCYAGLKLVGGNQAEYSVVAENLFARNYIGIFANAGNSAISGNQIHDNYEGLLMQPENYRNHCIISGNSINHSYLASFYIVSGTIGSDIIANVVRGGGDIYLLSSGQNVIRGNTFNSSSHCCNNDLKIVTSPGYTNFFIENRYTGLPNPVVPVTIVGGGVIQQWGNFVESENQVDQVTAKFFSGNGAGLTNLNAAATTGTLPDARLSANVALRSGGNVFTGTQVFSNTAVRLGAGGTNYAASGQENLRFIRGTVNGNGTIASGAGFTASRTAVGKYHVTFTTAFLDSPSVTVTQKGLGSSQWDAVTTASVDISTYDDAGAASDIVFSFIAAGSN